jgi:hypothetical protein
MPLSMVWMGLSMLLRQTLGKYRLSRGMVSWYVDFSFGIYPAYGCEINYRPITGCFYDIGYNKDTTKILRFYKKINCFSSKRHYYLVYKTLGR